MKTHKICHISTVHIKQDIRIFHKECISLAAYGYDVTFLNQGTHDVVEYGVRRLGSGRPVIKNKLIRMTLGCRRLVKQAIRLDADVYHIHDSELLRYAKKLKKAGKIVIYDSHEHLPMQIMEKEWLPVFLRGPIAGLIGRFELSRMKLLDLIIVVADKTFDRFKDRGVRVVKIENLPIFEEFKDIEINYDSKKERRIICYSGAVWLERGLDTMCEAAAGLDGCRFIIAGRIDHDSPEDYVKSIGDNIEYTGYLSRSGILSLYEESIAGVCLFKPYPNNMIDPPTKIFEYMAAGIPVIASKFDSITGVVEKYNCGICVDPLDIGEIRNAMQYILDNPDKAAAMGSNGREIVAEKLNWEEHSKLLFKEYEGLVGKQDG